MNFTQVKSNDTGAATSNAKTVSQWSKGETYLGFLKQIRDITTKLGPAFVYDFADADPTTGKPTGKMSSFFGSTVLNPLLKQVKQNQVTLIECKGKNAGSRAIQFTVQTAETYLEQVG